MAWCHRRARRPAGRLAASLVLSALALPALVLDVELCAVTPDPAAHELARDGVARHGDGLPVPIRALERHDILVLGERRHRHATVARARRVVLELAQAAADLPTTDVVDYTSHDRRGNRPRRLFAPGLRPAASPGKGSAVI